MRSLIHKQLVPICSVCFLLFASSGWTQTGTASLHGTVADVSRAVVAGARVTLVNQAQGLIRSATTASTGEFDFLALPPGTYVLTVEKEGFKKYEQTNVQLLVNVLTTVNVALQVGSVTSSVEVGAVTETINTVDASIGNAFNEVQVKQLPLEGRNVPDLLTLQPGVARI